MRKMSLSAKDIVYVCFCPRCNRLFGHKTSKKKVEIERKKHMDHYFDIEPVTAKMLTPKIEALILKNLEEW